MPGILLDEPQSQTPGARKALSIGIQYTESGQYSVERGFPPPMLQAAHRDPDVLKEIIKHYGYQEKDIVVLKDDGKHTLPTGENILKAIDDLVRDARAGDHFVFHYSGHGSQVPNQEDDDDEDDGMDEVIWPVDIICTEDGEVADNYIRDDELKKRLIDVLPAGTHLTIVFDCCHSGTGADLPNSRIGDNEESGKLWSPLQQTAPRPFDDIAGAQAGNTAPKVGTRGIFKLTHKDVVRPNSDVGQTNVHEIIADKHVTSWAACIDGDIEVESLDGGMLTQAFRTVLDKNRSQTYRNLLDAIEKHLVISTVPAKKVFLEENWGELKRPKPVLGSLHKLDKIYNIPFTF
ncbi:hypothetical protein M0805_002090 [Coniferiporia weirii]|nr:hypothetical protein M0805_002090 [Coniferiporia weirii]